MQALPTVPSTLLSAEELATRVKPGPRYTSYPPATCFTPDVGPDRAGEILTGLAAAADRPIGLYVHVPFCPSLCWYCGCNVEVTRDRSRGKGYVELLLAELDLVRARLGARPVAALSLGGGSPNFLSSADLTRLVEGIDARFGFDAGAELHAELDPRATTIEQVETLGALGFSRLSVGVQDFSIDVQKAIHRVQSMEQTARLIGAARDAGFRSVNIDLIYGLPLQTIESITTTMDRVLLLHPDRMALFGYAHVPHLRPHQRLVEKAGPMPGSVARAELLLAALAVAERAGYVRIGLDHLAAPDDELVKAAASGGLERNFQGYVVKKAETLIGVGASAISDTGDAYWQNHAELGPWTEAVERGELPVARGVVLDAEDQLRRHVITRLMCDGHLDLADVSARFGIDAEAHFARELAALEAGPEAGLAVWDREARALRATAEGELLIRNVCMLFDTHLPVDMGAPGRPRHSPTI
ncbi:MAG: oxygen-independent coproporphyrinogen III oxidase [Kofleriaceae bacterium]|nr:oxygen-independent coproporphyrinogen III oxidase [Myxococcales bacterium]MCB9573310.1 oxygen-independent coproporphyrinogen III oxidase [Kofleriaceae bacterium]